MIIVTEKRADILFTLEALTQAFIIFAMGVAIIFTNLLIIATFINFRANEHILTHVKENSFTEREFEAPFLYKQGPTEVINIYLLSLAVADFLCGVLIVPLSVYPAYAHEWVYGDLACRLLGYLEVTLWSASIFTFMWISVDRYLAIRKPLRYDTVQTKTRCQCWMVFTWISSALLCCPPLLGVNKPFFDHDAYVCLMDWSNMVAYSVTVAILILGPSLITIVYTYFYIFSTMRKVRSGVPIHDKEYATALTENLSNPSNVMSFVLVLLFCLSWTPFISVKVYEHFTNTKFQIPFLHFGIVWIGVLNSFWKFVILLALSPQFRLALRVLCLTMCCRSKARLQAELMGMEDD